MSDLGPPHREADAHASPDIPDHLPQSRHLSVGPGTGLLWREEWSPNAQRVYLRLSLGASSRPSLRRGGGKPKRSARRLTASILPRKPRLVEEQEELLRRAPCGLGAMLGWIQHAE